MEQTVVFLLLLIQSLTSGISNMLLIINVTDDFSELNQHLITLYRRLNGNLMPLMQASNCWYIRRLNKTAF